MGGLSVVLLESVLAVSAFPIAAAGPTEVQSSAVQYASGKDTVEAYLSIPKTKGPFPAIIIIHEWWGLNDWITASAGRLARQGYITLAIDLYRGRTTSSPDEARKLSGGVPKDRATQDLKAAFTYLKGRKDVLGNKIGAIGWCMGGKYSLLGALNIPDLAACVVCYGQLVTDSALAAKIPCPILGIFGEQDRVIPPADVRAFEDACKAAGKWIEVKEYAGAGHAFMNPSNKDGYREEATKDAWSRIENFFASNLKRH